MNIDTAFISQPILCNGDYHIKEIELRENLQKLKKKN